MKGRPGRGGAPGGRPSGSRGVAPPDRRRRAERGLPDGRTRLLGILGDPLVHSLSPSLHSEVLRRLDRNLIYVPFPVSKDRLRSFLRLAPRLGILGVNVTTPYKEALARLVRPLDEETRRTGVVNTILFRGEEALGCGTDGAGILATLRSWDGEVLPFGILGFGATARSLAARSLREGAPVAAVVTRDPARVRRRLRAWGAPAVRVVSWDDPKAAAGLARWVSTLPPEAAIPPEFWSYLARRARLLDLNYGEGRTAIADAARAAGIPAAGGLAPLCHQAALSLGLWLGTAVSPRLFLAASGRSARSLRPAR